MTISSELLHELDLLTRYTLDTAQVGLKIHSDADPQVINAIERLFSKGLVSQQDGGYLTDRGREAAAQLQTALALLRA